MTYGCQHNKNTLAPQILTCPKQNPSTFISLYITLFVLFLYTLKWLSSFLFSKAETISGKNNSNFFLHTEQAFWENPTRLHVTCTNT